MIDLFVYGTLMAADVMRCVSGYAQPGEPAVLHDFRRRRVLGEAYPAIVRRPGEVVDGLLYRAVDSGQLAWLDGFEGEMYRRDVVEVVCGSCRVTAEAYVMVPRFADLLSADAWSLERFLCDGLADFLAAYPGFRAIAERAPTHGAD
jgi:gamma-glutamylcyclotransferase (GGCT)/AIG2-like uncharacterized protein YtfP